MSAYLNMQKGLKEINGKADTAFKATYHNIDILDYDSTYKIATAKYNCSDQL